ncbi:uncharacterized protein [Macrobrachium rosenbergii]|uniref:uncharacterized protein n=1 Tax=Macrobrachium rosenbergii TaxID=79674 RepID=UPI0034D4F0F8
MKYVCYVPLNSVWPFLVYPADTHLSSHSRWKDDTWYDSQNSMFPYPPATALPGRSYSSVVPTILRSNSSILNPIRHIVHVVRVKQEDAATKKKLCRTGGGPPPDLRKPSEEFVIAASLMTEELTMDKDVIETFHPVDETGETIHDVRISITEPLPSTPAQVESGVSSNDATSTIPSRSIEHLIFKPIVSPETSRPSTPIVTPGRPSPNTSRDVSPIPRSSTPIDEAHSSTKKSKLDDAYIKCRERQEELHLLRMENEKERHIMAKKEHELKVKLINNMNKFVDEMRSSAMTVFDNLNAFLNSGNSAYEAMRNSYE